MLLLNLAILMFVACLLSASVFIYGYRVAIGGFAWAGLSLLVLLKFQYSLMKRVLKEYPPQAVPTAPGARALGRGGSSLIQSVDPLFACSVAALLQAGTSAAART